MQSDPPVSHFDQLDLPPALQQALADVGYETPSAIQAATIPALLRGVDLVGQAQTGTGKTAAFALPCLARLDLSVQRPQVLVLAPTRELAIQVAEAFQRYAHYLQGFHVLPLYGGSDMRTQLRQLARGAQVIVGTPGRVMDHMRRGSLDLSALRTVVLDEADEMLRMGFIDDVEWVLEQTPPERQVVLFSATMPEQIRRIARRHLRDAEEVTIKVSTVTNAAIRQRVWMMSGVHKLDALTRILEVEEVDGIIIFVRTRLATAELAEKLAARGFAAAALNGDVAQKQREKIVEDLKKGRLDILVATDVAARGLDVERISHVINYDIPYDVEAYVHRIGRTGRAGRHGEAILFAASRERRLLRAIERATGSDLEPMTLPSSQEVSDRRQARFMQQISATLDSADLDAQRELVQHYQREYGVPVLEIAAALAAMVHQAMPAAAGAPAAVRRDVRDVRAGRAGRESAQPAGAGLTQPEAPDAGRPSAGQPPRRARAAEQPAAGMERYRIEVGHQHQVKPGNIVGAIANEADIDAQYIGRIAIHDEYSTVDLPEGMPPELLSHLQTVWVSGQQLRMRPVESGAAAGDPVANVRRKARSAGPVKRAARDAARGGNKRPGQGKGPARASDRRRGGPPSGA
jgi:ATP-dependent RNA helicase DeaD